MNLKAFALSALTIATMGATPALALDYPGAGGGRTVNPGYTGNICAVSTNMRSEYFSQNEQIRCTVTKRTNVNGHVVYDVQWNPTPGWSGKTSVVLWSNGVAEYWQDGERFTGRHQSYGDGQTIIFSDHSDYHFVF